MNDLFFVCCSFSIEAKGTKLSSEPMLAQTHHLGKVVASPPPYDELGVNEFWSADTLARFEAGLERLDAALRVHKQNRETLEQRSKYFDERLRFWQGLVAPSLASAEEKRRVDASFTEVKDAKQRQEASFAELMDAKRELEAIEIEMATPEFWSVFNSIAIPLKCEDPRNELAYAVYRGVVWSCQRQLTPDQWALLADRFVEQENAELASALGGGEESSLTRERISAEVRRAVWIRDQGMCARCKSRERLEFDHIVPLARGGSNTERNIELLCEVCNRAKSDAIM